MLIENGLWKWAFVSLKVVSTEGCVAVETKAFYLPALSLLQKPGTYRQLPIVK